MQKGKPGEISLPFIEKRYHKYFILENPERQSWGGSASYTLRARSPPQHLPLGKVPVITTRKNKKSGPLLTLPLTLITVD